jgi:betaine reductase
LENIRVMHYLNQFFAGKGGEDKADVAIAFQDGTMGPGRRLQDLLGESAKVVATAYCGDNYFAEHRDDVIASILKIAKEKSIQVVVAGPAFQAGRYGFACVEICHALAGSGISCVTGMHAENPGIDTYQQYKDRKVYLLPTTEEIRGMEDALSRMAKFVRKLGSGLAIGPAAEEGYVPRGIRVVEFVRQSGVERAIDMVLKLQAGKPFETEIPTVMSAPVVAPAPVKDLTHAHMALVTECGIVPAGNPDMFQVRRNTKWGKYPIGKLSSMKESSWEVKHSGWYNAFMMENFNFGVPLDVCREMEREGGIGKIYPDLYSTSGNAGLISEMQRVGKEMAEDMKKEGVNAVLLVAT